MTEDMFRYIGLWILSFIIGMNSYIAYKIHMHSKKISYRKSELFDTTMKILKWLYLNQTAILIMMGISRTQRILQDVPLVWIDFVAIPMLISYLCFDLFVIKKIINRSLGGQLFDKKKM